MIGKSLAPRPRGLRRLDVLAVGAVVDLALFVALGGGAAYAAHAWLGWSMPLVVLAGLVAGVFGPPLTIGVVVTPVLAVALVVLAVAGRVLR